MSKVATESQGEREDGEGVQLAALPVELTGMGSTNSRDVLPSGETQGTPETRANTDRRISRTPATIPQAIDSGSQLARLADACEATEKQIWRAEGKLVKGSGPGNPFEARPSNLELLPPRDPS